MHLIQYNSKQEACFLCPNSVIEPFTAFLKKESIEILNSKYFGEQSGEKIYMIEVSEIGSAKSKQVISKFTVSLKSSS